MRASSLVLLLSVFVFGLSPQKASADPCGMVPPIYTGPGVAIKRIGPQKTYVFYKNGVESIVLRPAFSGKVDNFGMLIPFPGVPAIRKMPDTIFKHIGAAIDPPEVSVWVNPPPVMSVPRATRALGSVSPTGGSAVPRNKVRVLKQEAVGMYQVAVLQAGSPKALKRWMDANGYKYPKGMDKVVLDYVNKRWVFVAVKTRVAGKQGVRPRPGMRRTKARFPKGGAFVGAVQAMGFRFRTKRLVVPMRLSAFNAGRLRNVVYILTNGPKSIKHIDRKFVRRQVSGKQIYDNVTKLLPMMVYRGNIRKLAKHRWKYLQQRRNPTPFNGHARDLFASDLRAVMTGKLSLPHEELKKLLLRIGERLKLRGPVIDRYNRKELAAYRERIAARALRMLKGMTMTVVDGDFPRQILARENLTFRSYRMPAAKNKTSLYNCRTAAIAKVRAPWGRRWRRPYYYGGKGTRSTWQGPRYARPKKKPLPRIPSARRYERTMARKARKNRIYKHILALTNARQVNAAVASLVKMGDRVIPYLWGEAVEGKPPIRRGWSLVALSELGNRKVMPRILKLFKKSQETMLVRTWAGAAYVSLIKSVKELESFLQHSRAFAALKRPMSKKLKQLMRHSNAQVETLLSIAQRHWQMRGVVMPYVLAAGPKALARVMVRGKNNRTRRMAAGYLASLGRKKPAATERAVLQVLRFRAGAKVAPWKGGALFVPGIPWNRKPARALVHNLLAWMIWSDRNKKPYLRQIHNNLRSLRLARQAGYRSPGWRRVPTSRWLSIWRNAVGCDALRRLLKEVGPKALSDYQSSLSGCQ